MSFRARVFDVGGESSGGVRGDLLEGVTEPGVLARGLLREREGWGTTEWALDSRVARRRGNGGRGRGGGGRGR